MEHGLPYNDFNIYQNTPGLSRGYSFIKRLPKLAEVFGNVFVHFKHADLGFAVK